MARAPTGRTNRVVVLNASYEVLSVVALHRAVAYLLREKAEIVAQRDGAAMHSSSGLSIPVPTVVRLLRYVRVPYRHQVPAWTKAGLLRRDRHTCAYCGHRGATVEHLVPGVQGRPVHLGEHRRGLRELQHPQGQPHSGGGGHGAVAASDHPHGPDRTAARVGRHRTGRAGRPRTGRARVRRSVTRSVRRDPSFHSRRPE